MERDETPINDAISCLVDFSWLAQSQERDYNEVKFENRYRKSIVKAEESAVKSISLTSVKKELMLPLSYDEFKVSKSFMIDSDQSLQTFLKGNFSDYVYERSKYNIV